jgi:hypothetical protein
MNARNETDLPHWDADRAEFCAEIEKVRSPIKIVLKTRNDPFFIERWIKHHMKIVGPENLIIFDNMSDDPELLAVYGKYRRQLNIVRYSGRHYNEVHHTETYKELYRSLARSSEYFMVLDTDEYLILIENDAFYDGDRIVEFVMANRNQPLLPSTWLWNVNWSSTQFRCGDNRRLAEDLSCGKPLLRSDSIQSGYVCHNFQLGPGLFKPPLNSNLFLLHLTRLIPQQRISANLNKLIGGGVARSGESPESVVARTDITDALMLRHVGEIRELLALRERQDLGEAALPAGSLELMPDGTIGFSSDAERNVFSEYVADSKPVYDLIAKDVRSNRVAS